MFFNFCGVKIFYDFKNNGKKPLLFLHGWGCDSQIFENFLTYFQDKNTLAIDFPPFGKSSDEPDGWNVFTYANMVISLCEQNKLHGVDVIGHSFGGRVAIILCALRPDIFDRCILLDSAGLRPRRGIKYFAKVYSYKFAKKIGFKFQSAGSEDYRALSDNMKKVFVSIVNESLDEYLPLIKQPTLIIFGKNDKDTPLFMAKKLHRNIKNSRLEILKGAGHFVFVDCPLKCFKLIDEFLEEK